MTSKPENKLTLKDRLSRLTYLQATKLLGDDGKKLLQLGGAYEIDIAQQVYFRGDLFQVKLPAYGEKASPVVSIMMLAEAKKRLKFDCTHCNGPCEHVGAAFGLILEEKMALGLSKPPKERKPLESLSEEELVAQAIADRKERAKTEKFKLTSNQPKKAWGDYTLTSKASGKSYHLSVFGTKRGESYCSCPDFRKNTLGTCKHLLYAVNRIKTKFPSSKRQTYKPKHFSLQLAFESDADGASSGQISLRLTPPSNLEPEADKIAGKLLNRNSNNVSKLIRTITKLERADYRVHIRPDAAEYIDQRLHQQRIEDLVKEIRTDPTKHPLRTSLLKTELLPYQMDGVAFAAGAGRAILADDMGLGKTIQGIGVAELLAQEAGLKKVLVICPTSLKSQWAAEIAKFCDRDSQLILGSAQ